MSKDLFTLQHTAPHCTTLQHKTTHCNTLQYTATHCSTLQHTATHLVQLSNRVPRIWEVFKDLCTLRTQHHTATHCNTLQQSSSKDLGGVERRVHTAAHSTTLQHTATHCNTLQHTLYSSRIEFQGSGRCSKTCVHRITSNLHKRNKKKSLGSLLHTLNTVKRPVCRQSLSI